MNKILPRHFFGMMVLCSGLNLAGAATVQVSIVGTSFNPKVVTVNVGDTVVWSNGQDVHTVSPNGGVTESFCGGFSITSCSHVFNRTGSFAYHCNFHENSHSMTGLVIVVAAPTNSGVPPTVAITGLAEQALLAAHRSVNIGVNANDADGSVVSVTWQTNGVTLAVSTIPPFSLTTTGLVAGQPSLRAIATDSQSLSATSAPVNLRLVTPPVLSFVPDGSGAGQFLFQTVPGVNYIIESAEQLSEFSPQATNAGNGTVQNFFSSITVGQKFFRLRLE